MDIFQIQGIGQIFQRHLYPKTIWISTPFTDKLVGDWCNPETQQPRFDEIIEELYRFLFAFIINLLPTKTITQPTRMQAIVPDAKLICQVPQEQKIIVCAIARAGNLTSEIIYKLLLKFFQDPSLIRRDCLMGERQKDPKTHKIIGCKLNTEKIGGSCENAILVIPDPMGATGTTTINTIKTYKEQFGKPKKVILVHIFVTPEYIKNLNNNLDGIDWNIITLHVDRSGSSEQALKEIPGKLLEQEFGLTEQGYIRCGPGDVGAIQNNTPGV